VLIPRATERPTDLVGVSVSDFNVCAPAFIHQNKTTSPSQNSMSPPPFDGKNFPQEKAQIDIRQFFSVNLLVRVQFTLKP